MALKTYKPVTPSRRQLVLVDRSGLFQGKPVKTLTEGKNASGGRNKTSVARAAIAESIFTSAARRCGVCGASMGASAGEAAETFARDDWSATGDDDGASITSPVARGLRRAIGVGAEGSPIVAGVEGAGLFCAVFADNVVSGADGPVAAAWAAEGFEHGAGVAEGA